MGLKEAEEKLFEINFNRKEVINSSLDAQIRCGWEAETVWENIEGVDDDVDNMTTNTSRMKSSEVLIGIAYQNNIQSGFMITK